MMPAPPKALIHWQHGSVVRKHAQPPRPAIVRDLRIGIVNDFSLPRLADGWYKQPLRLIGAPPAAEPYHFPTTLTAFQLPAYLAREFFRRENDPALMAFKDREVALGRALAAGESVCTTFRLPDQAYVKRALNWGVEIIVTDFRLSR